MATLDTSSPAAVSAAPPAPPPDRVFARRFAGVLSILGGLALWELVSRFVVANPLFLAAPTQIVGAIWSLAVSGELWPHISISAAEFARRLCHRERARRRDRHGDGGERDRAQGAGAVDFRALCDPDHRARAAVHPVARHRHLVEGARRDHAGDLPRRHQHRGRAAHHEPAAHRDAARASARRRGRSSSSCRCRRRPRSSSPASSSASAAA